MFESELADIIPVVKTSIAGTRIIDRLCVGKDLQSFNGFEAFWGCFLFF